MKNFKKIILILTAVVISGLAVYGLVYAYKASVNNGQDTDKPKFIGGDKDEGGCLIAAGYSWCEIKNKCLRVWEEPCITLETQSLVETYLKNNISELSPEKEVLGGKFYITQFRFAGDEQVTVDYEDGHIALQAEVLYVVKDGKVIINKFSLVNANDSVSKNASKDIPDADELTLLFSKKYSIEPKNIIVRITDNQNPYFRGSVKLSLDENAPGGYFLAKIVDGKYQLVADGNGQIDCGLVSDFPPDMISDCVNIEL